MTMELDEPTLLLLRQFQALEYVRTIIVTLFFYDYLTALKREISSIWFGKWTTLNILYLLARYVPFVNFVNMIMTILIDLSPKLCKPMFHFSMWSSMIGISLAEACFCLRAYALCGASRNAAIFLVVLFSTMVITGFTINGIMASSATMIQPPFKVPGLTPRCILRLEGNNYAICGWIIIVIVDTALISMIIYAKRRMYHSSTTDRNNLLNQIYRDAIVYFLCNFLISTTSVILYLIAPGPIKEASSIFGLTMFSILSCKIMLRLRAYGNSHLLDQDIGTLNTSMALSSLRFRSTAVHSSCSNEC